jgi:alkylation response protein AidB-like acyl-CoA dehydrogenase
VFDLTLDASQEAVAAHFARMFERECTTDVVRAAEPIGHSPELWAKLVGLEVPAVAAPEAAGGGGASMLEVFLIAEVAGRVLAPVPLVDHVVASRLHPDEGIVTGRLTAAFAPRPAEAGMWRLVPSGAVADVVVGLDGDELVAVRGEPPPGPPRNHADAPLADRSVTGAGVDDRLVIGDRGGFERALVEWKLLQAAMLAGLAARSLEIATEYVTGRSQFGRPVGGFQAVQHALADCVAPVQGNRLLAAKAAWALDQGLHGRVDVDGDDIEDPTTLATMAHVFAAETAAVVTARAVQFHGSYGVSREYDMQLYYRRARGWPLVLGDPEGQLSELADVIWPGED